MLETDFVVSVITGRQRKKIKVIGDKEDKNLLSKDRTSHIIYRVGGMWGGCECIIILFGSFGISHHEL